MSKGSHKRPSDIPKKEFDKNFDKIFGQPVKKPSKNRKETGV